MIIDFTVSNFRSIKEKQTLSLFADGGAQHLSDNVAYPVARRLGVLRTAGIYGANASGKSNWLLAFRALQYLVMESGGFKDGDSIPCYEPYLLFQSTNSSPVSFEIEFAFSGQRYVYEISFNANEIITESLSYFPGQQIANIFRKKEGESWENMAFGSKYTGGKKRYALFKNNSYLSKAGNSADSPEIIRSVYNFFRTKMFIFEHDHKFKLSSWKENTRLVKKVANILSYVDTGITNIEIKVEDITNIDFPAEMPEYLKKEIMHEIKYKTLFSHTGDDNECVEFPENAESAGTLKLYNILPLLMAVFKTGGIMVLDELDNSFHPHLAELIIKLFNDSSVNTNYAQLIFSTHNINLMSPEIFRRDQIWFTEKKDGATTLSCVAEFDKKVVKTTTPFGKWYDEGRLGAIPKINFAKIVAILAGESENA